MKGTCETFPGITGVILAGGHSTRMGEDKALLKVGGVPIIQRIRDTMQPHFQQLLLSTNHPECYDFLALPSVRDVVPEAGPLAGIQAALTRAETERVCVVSCDAAGVTSEPIKLLCQAAVDAPIVVMGDGRRLYPLMAVYHRSILPLIDERLRLRMRSMHGLLDAVGYHVILPAGMSEGIRDQIFWNLNTPDDYSRFIRFMHPRSYVRPNRENPITGRNAGGASLEKRQWRE
ncbi:MAG: molybdenum cofactor guanylyltransferase [Bacteroidota bacterium]